VGFFVLPDFSCLFSIFHFNGWKKGDGEVLLYRETDEHFFLIPFQLTRDLVMIRNDENDLSIIL